MPLRTYALVCGLLLAASCTRAERTHAGSAIPAASTSDPIQARAPAIDVAKLQAEPVSELRELVGRYATDRQALARRYDTPASTERAARLGRFYSDWDSTLDKTQFENLGTEGKIDWVLLRSAVQEARAELQRDAKRFREVQPWLPGMSPLVELLEARRRHEDLDPRQAAIRLDGLAQGVGDLHKHLSEDKPKATRGKPQSKSKPSPRSKASPARPSATLAFRTLTVARSFQRALKRWHDYYTGYDPMFTWWARDPYAKADKALTEYLAFLDEDVLGRKDPQTAPVAGDPEGRDGIVSQLNAAMIPYSPEELIKIARHQLAWCEREMLRASSELGFGDDWKGALERVKGMSVEPGKQTAAVRDLAHQAVKFIESRDLLTIPALAKEVWRMEMMSPERQKVNPFFTGGEVISVSFPTDGMGHEQKLMSLRANNLPFSKAVVHHELIPGHHLQGFMTSRYQPHRRVFGTPFWMEGWALYWELLLWDLGFPATAEERIGMLFWRMHRAARIIFSLGFHLEQMTPAEAIEFLVDRVGHERDSAEGEVRRSFDGSYAPLYQLAYLIGGLQFRALYQELVATGRISARAFHDQVLRGGPIPVEMVRARLLDAPPSRDHRPTWRFADQL